MKIDVLSLFPDMFDGIMSESMMWKARDRGLLDFEAHDIREHTKTNTAKSMTVPTAAAAA